MRAFTASFPGVSKTIAPVAVASKGQRIYAGKPQTAKPDKPTETSLAMAGVVPCVRLRRHSFQFAGFWSRRDDEAPNLVRFGNGWNAFEVIYSLRKNVRFLGEQAFNG